MRILAAILVFVACLFSPTLSSQSLAGLLEDANDAYWRGDYETEFILLKRLAEQGDAKAQYSVGFKYHNGRVVPQDYAEASKWYRKAAEQDHALAQYNLGVMSANGQGVPQDYAEAAKWYQKAAEHGHALAQYNLGVMYSNGQGVPQDYVLAHMWFNIAASASLFPTYRSVEVERAVKNRDLIASQMTPSQITEAQRLAREWKPKKEQ